MERVIELFGLMTTVFGGASDDALASLAVGVLGSCSIWMVLGWDRKDAYATLRRMGASVSHELERLAMAFGRVVKTMSERLGLHPQVGKAVSLGAVSEMIDIVQLGLKAGLSFDASLGLYCEGRTGVLSERMARARLMWQTGLLTREQGLLGVARELDVRSLESFAIAVTQAIDLGAPLADTLESQGREIRAAHRTGVERQIERAPVKLLIPTGTLILPALLLSIVGPLVAAGGLM